MGCGPSKHSLGMLAGIVYPQTVDFLCLKTKDIEKLIEFYKYVDVGKSTTLVIGLLEERNMFFVH